MTVSTWFGPTAIAESGGNEAPGTSNTAPRTDPGAVSDCVWAASCDEIPGFGEGGTGKLSSSAGWRIACGCAGGLFVPDEKGSATIGTFTTLVLPGVVALWPNIKLLNDNKKRRERTCLIRIQRYLVN